MENFWILFLIFTVYSFLGWLVESIFCSVPAGKFINRGFLNGPFCPVYGVGGVLAVTALTPLKNNFLLLYVVGVFGTSAVEYLTGFALEKLFHTKYWDYSRHRFNLQGRVCLDNSLLFGILCVVEIWYIHPTVMDLLNRIPEALLPFVSGAFLLYFAGDTAATVHTILQLNGKLDELQQIMDEIKQRASAAKTETMENIRTMIGGLIDEDTKARLDVLFEKMDRIETGSKRMQRRLIEAFPTMSYIRNNESMQRMKQVIADRAKKIKRL